MKTYNVKEIAELLNTDPETVRRWIRSGKLVAEQRSSRKEGNVVTAEMLNEFLKGSPKYAAVAASAIATPVAGLTAAAALLFGGLLTQQYVNGENVKHATVSATEVKKLLEEDINKRKQAILRKQETIRQLQSEISADESDIEAALKLMQDLDAQENELLKGDE